MLEFTEKVVGTASISITESDIENILVSSLEGGSNYWMGVDNRQFDFKDKPKDEPVSTWAVKLLLEGKKVYFFDIEQELNLDIEWDLTLEKLLKGIEQNFRERPFAADKENWDAADADCIIQYALFGKLVYG